MFLEKGQAFAQGSVDFGRLFSACLGSSRAEGPMGWESAMSPMP